MRGAATMTPLYGTAALRPLMKAGVPWPSSKMDSNGISNPWVKPEMKTVDKMRAKRRDTSNDDLSFFF
jgi:hypothetical protein